MQVYTRVEEVNGLGPLLEETLKGKSALPVVEEDKYAEEEASQVSTAAAGANTTLESQPSAPLPTSTGASDADGCERSKSKDNLGANTTSAETDLTMKDRSSSAWDHLYGATFTLIVFLVSFRVVYVIAMELSGFGSLRAQIK